MTLANKILNEFKKEWIRQGNESLSTNPEGVDLIPGKDAYNMKYILKVLKRVCNMIENKSKQKD